jgi:hypothetical protein
MGQQQISPEEYDELADFLRWLDIHAKKKTVTLHLARAFQAELDARLKRFMDVVFDGTDGQ